MRIADYIHIQLRTSSLPHSRTLRHTSGTSEAIPERAYDMKNRTLERARKKAHKIMDDLEGEGMFTLAELKRLLESELQNRLRTSVPLAGEATVLRRSR